jgi:excisionase family DNA binding protein
VKVTGPDMSISEAALDLNVHYMTVSRYVRQGRLPATRKGMEWRLRAGDNAGAWWLIENQLASAHDTPGVLTVLVVPALRSIGDRWRSGEIFVAQEHAATAVAQRLVGRLGLQFGRRGKSRGLVALTAPSGDLHSLPVARVADLLRWRDVDVLELGADTPDGAMVDAVASVPRLIGLGFVSTTKGRASTVSSSVAAARYACSALPIFIGGGAIGSAAQARPLGADLWTGTGPHAAVDTVELLLQRKSRSTKRTESGFDQTGTARSCSPPAHRFPSRSWSTSMRSPFPYR